VAQNAGNTSMAYSFNLKLANPQSEPGLTYQLLIYRLYFVPVANGCELTEASQQELLVNDLAPKLNANLLDPNGGASFFLNPGDSAIATLRVVPNPDSTPPGDPSHFNIQDLSASVVSKGVNSADAANGDSQPPVAILPAPSLPPLTIDTATLPYGSVGTMYSTTLAATCGSPPLTWSVTGESVLPPGVTMASSGILSGTPTGSGSFTLTVRVTDGTQLAERTFTLVVSSVVAPLRFAYQGTVDRTDGHAAGGAPNPAPYAAFLGQTIRVEYTFDPTTADNNPSANGDYLGAVKTLTVTVGLNVYTAMTGTITIINSPPQPDQYIVDVPTGLAGPAVGGVPVARIEIILTDPTRGYFSTDALPATPPDPFGFSQRAIQLQFWDNSDPDPLRPYGIIQANNVAVAEGGLTFVTQPVSTSPNASVGNVQVMATDLHHVPIPGATVTMTLVPNGNTGTLVPPTSMHSTDPTGLATFAGLEVTAAGSGYRLLATSGGVAALSDAFDISGAVSPGITTVWILDNLDPDSSTPPFTDTLTIRDAFGAPLATTAAFNVAQSIGAWRAISVAPSGDYALVAQFGPVSGDTLTKIDSQGHVLWSVVMPELNSVAFSTNGFAYALTGATIYGTSIRKVNPANGDIVASAAYGGVDLVVDDTHDAIWVVGDKIRKLNRNLALQAMVTPDPIAWSAVSVDYSSDGSVWVAERQYSLGTGQDRLL
jgi:hypothetical protein